MISTGEHDSSNKKKGVMRPCTIEMQGSCVPVVHDGSLLHAAGGPGVPETAVSHMCVCERVSVPAKHWCIVQNQFHSLLNPKLAHTWPAWLLLPVRPDAALTELRLTRGQKGWQERDSKVRSSTSSQIRRCKREKGGFFASPALLSFCQTFTRLRTCGSHVTGPTTS